MTKEIIEKRRLTERLKHKGQTLHLLERSEKVAVYYKLSLDDPNPITFFVGLIYKNETISPEDNLTDKEYLKDYDSLGNPLLHEHHVFKSAFKLFRKLFWKYS